MMNFLNALKTDECPARYVQLFSQENECTYSSRGGSNMYKSGSIKISQRNPTEINKSGANAKVKILETVVDVFFLGGGGGRGGAFL